jgi:hypothetical protein
MGPPFSNIHLINNAQGECVPSCRAFNSPECHPMGMGAKGGTLETDSGSENDRWISLASAAPAPPTGRPPSEPG